MSDNTTEADEWRQVAADCGEHIEKLEAENRRLMDLAAERFDVSIARQEEIERLRKVLDGADGLLMAAAENLRSADKDERRVEAAFRIAGKLDKLRSALKGGEEGGEAPPPRKEYPDFRKIYRED